MMDSIAYVLVIIMFNLGRNPQLYAMIFCVRLRYSSLSLFDFKYQYLLAEINAVAFLMPYRAQASQLFLATIFLEVSWMTFYHLELDQICYWAIFIAGMQNWI
jgi:hypothetical protein